MARAHAHRNLTFTESWSELLPRRFVVRFVDPVHREAARQRETERLDRRANRRNARAAAFAGLAQWPLDAQVRLVASLLERWCTERAWAVCERCGGLQFVALHLMEMSASDGANVVDGCRFCRARHCVPHPEDIPAVLLGLRRQQICALRPLVLHQGDFVQAANGLRRHTSMSRLSWAVRSVRAQIDALDAPLRPRCIDAYEYLMQCDASPYRDWVNRHANMLLASKGGQSLGPLALLERTVETALWPDLYWSEELCESGVAGSAQRFMSAKEAFMAKLCAPILDYGLDYDLIQFQFDRWVLSYFTSRSGVCPDLQLKWLLRRFPDAPQQNYMNKLYIVDLHRQLGAGALFITLAPGLFAMPFPELVGHARRMAGIQILGCNALESLHVLHVLDQICMAYVTHRDQRSLRSPYGLVRGPRASGNVIEASVIKYEFQDGTSRALPGGAREAYHGTGVVHAHILIWVRDVARTALLKWLCSTGSGHEADLQTAIAELQRNDGNQTSQGVRFHAEESGFDDGVLTMQGNENSRVCIAPLALSYLCHSDVSVVAHPGAVTDYMGKLCRYASKDISGLQEDWLDTCASGLQAARLYLRTAQPSIMKQLGMLREATNVHFSCARKEVFLNPPCDLFRDELARKYMRCSIRGEQISYLQWLRAFNTSVDPPRKYTRLRGGRVALAVHFASRASDSFYGQWLVAHVPFRQIEDLQPPTMQRAPTSHRWFAACVLLRPDIWRNVERIQSDLQIEACSAGTQAGKGNNHKLSCSRASHESRTRHSLTCLWLIACRVSFA